MQDDRGIMWQRDFILTLNSATCDASCGGSFMETIHFKDAPMVFGSQPQTTATLPCIKPQQVSLPTIASRSIKAIQDDAGSLLCLLSCRSLSSDLRIGTSRCISLRPVQVM